jgi:hypothetical protein
LSAAPTRSLGMGVLTNGGGLATSGVYVARVRTESEEVVRKFVFVR